MGNFNLVIRAAKFAREAHESIDQRRKYTGEPFFTHPERVALLLSEYVDDPELIAAAYLHDAVEDVTHGPRPVTHELIVSEYEGFAVVFLAEKAAILKLFADENDRKEVAFQTGVGFVEVPSPYQRLLVRATDLVNDLLEKVSLKT